VYYTFRRKKVGDNLADLLGKAPVFGAGAVFDDRGEITRHRYALAGGSGFGGHGLLLRLGLLLAGIIGDPVSNGNFWRNESALGQRINPSKSVTLCAKHVVCKPLTAARSRVLPAAIHWDSAPDAD
jgi:hypothetical protein